MQEVLELKARFGAGALLVAGGTDLIAALRSESPSLPPVEVIDITRIQELKGISIEDGRRSDQGRGRQSGKATCPRVRLGPLVTHNQIERSPDLRKWAGLLAEASAEIGSPQIRNRGTIGGNILNASPCADTLPPLIALGTELTLRSVRGARGVAIGEAILTPYRTVLADDEVLTDIRFALVPEEAGSAFIKLARRKALSVSRMSIAVIVERDAGGILGNVRVAAGAVAPIPRRFPEIEKLLSGKTPTAGLFSAAGGAMAAEMIRISGRRWSTPYKQPAVSALLRRALSRAIGRIRLGQCHDN